MTSGTLNKKEHLEETYGIEFRLSENYKLENDHKLYWSTITYVKNKKLKINYKFFEKHEIE